MKRFGNVLPAAVTVARAFSAAVIAATLFAQAPAQEPPAQPSSASIPPLREVKAQPRIGIVGETRINLAEVIERILLNDRNLAISRIQLEQAGYRVRGALGVYDPTFSLRAYRNRTVTPIASLIGGAASGKLTQEEWAGTPQFGGLLPSLGGSYNFTFNNARQVTDSTFNTLNPQYPTALKLDLTQPLWRGLRFDDARYGIQVARKNRQLSSEQFRQRVIEVTTQAINAYWELVYASQAYEVQNEAVRLAQRQFASNRRQAEQGTLSPVDVVAAQTQVATFEQSLFAAQQLLTQAENNLKSMILPNRDDILWRTALIPESQPSTEVTLPTFDEAMRAALGSRPELGLTALQLELNQLDQRRTRELAKPQVNAFAAMTAAGLAGIPHPLNISFPGFSSTGPPPILVGSYGQSIDALAGGNFPSIQVGLQISLPIRNRSAEAQVAVASAEGRRLSVVRDQVGMAIEADVRNAMQAVTSAQSRLEASGVARGSAEEQYASEQRQFQAGTSTVFLVFQRQTDLINARSREVRARADLGEAIANLDRALARTIEAQRIKLIP